MYRIITGLLIVSASFSIFSSAENNKKLENNNKLMSDLISCVKTSKDSLEKIEELIKSISIVNGKISIKGISNQEDIDFLLTYLNDNPVLFSSFNNLLSPNKNCTQKIAQYLPSISGETLKIIKWCTLSSSATLLSTIAVNSLMSQSVCSAFPTGNWLGLTLSSGTIGSYLIYKYFKTPDSLTEKLMWKAFGLGAKLIPYIGKAIASTITSSQIKTSPKTIQAFRDLTKSLSKEQKNLLSHPIILFSAAFQPALLMREINFLNNLNTDQISTIYCLFRSMFEDRNFDLFDKFANSLEKQQLEKLIPGDKLLLAQFCPKLLYVKENINFLQSLSENQANILQDYITCEEEELEKFQKSQA